jgi:protein TonB
MAGGKPAALDVGAHTDSLLALFQQALFADSALATVRAASLPDTTPVKVVAPIADTPPEAIERVAPVYPDSARAAGIEGTVIVRALVSSEGRVMRVQVMTSVPGLDDAALTAVKQWRFKPATSDGKPRATGVNVPVTFHLAPASPKAKR